MTHLPELRGVFGIALTTFLFLLNVRIFWIVIPAMMEKINVCFPNGVKSTVQICCGLTARIRISVFGLMPKFMLYFFLSLFILSGLFSLTKILDGGYLASINACNKICHIFPQPMNWIFILVIFYVVNDGLCIRLL